MEFSSLLAIPFVPFVPTILLDWFCSGYLAPEYAIRNQVTRKSDVYSFGVLLLEIVSGRPNTNRRLPVEEQYLLTRVSSKDIFFMQILKK